MAIEQEKKENFSYMVRHGKTVVCPLCDLKEEK